MTGASGFDLHPEAARDITEIWEDIASEKASAAGRVREDILQAISHPRTALARRLVNDDTSPRNGCCTEPRPMRSFLEADYLASSTRPSRTSCAMPTRENIELETRKREVIGRFYTLRGTSARRAA
jgi:plasmid stabilization system protein ParE